MTILSEMPDLPEAALQDLAERKGRKVVREISDLLADRESIAATNRESLARPERLETRVRLG